MGRIKNMENIMQNQENQKQMGHSRVLKFRAWDGNKIITQDKLIAISGVDRTLQDVLDNIQEKDTKCILMQFTGLLDKNGKEIYEGDILCIDDSIIADYIGGHARYEPENRIEAVYWDELHGMWVTKSDNLAEQYADCEIIGNIYENPELLQTTPQG